VLFYGFLTNNKQQLQHNPIKMHIKICVIWYKLAENKYFNENGVFMKFFHIFAEKKRL